MSPTVVLTNIKFPERSAVDNSPRECVQMTLVHFHLVSVRKNHQTVPSDAYQSQKPPSSINSLIDKDLYDLIQKRNNPVRYSNHWHSLIDDTYRTLKPIAELMSQTQGYLL